MKKLKIQQFPPVNYACQEAINTLCTNLSFSGSSTKKIVFTSSHSGEGKSFTVMNIMRTMAGLGYKVALVDADLRKSKIVNDFKIEGIDSGLVHFLAGKVDMSQVLYRTDIDNAYIVPSGRNITNPLPLLNSVFLKQLLDYLSEKMDYIFVDAPAIGAVIDAAEISKSCDAIVLVVEHKGVKRKELIEVRDQLTQTGCPVLGAVLSKVVFDDSLSNKYYYKAY